jgi:hypothetical protein
VQITRTLNIFEQKHPNYIAILIFNQSSVHASHSEGTLNAFSINKALGGVEKGNIKPYRRDTYFPPEYTIPGLQGTIQVLWQLNPNGEESLRAWNRFSLSEGTIYLA